MAKEKPQDYADEIAKLEAMRKAIDDAITGFKILAGQSGLMSNLVRAISSQAAQAAFPLKPSEGDPKKDEVEPVSADVRRDTFFSMSITDAAEKYLRMQKEPRPAKEICKMLKAGGLLTTAKNFYVTVYSSMLRDARFKKVGKEWGLAEWYPGRGPKNAEKK
jgi:hypothetical protein